MSFMQSRFVGFFGVYSGCCSVEIVLFFCFLRAPRQNYSRRVQQSSLMGLRTMCWCPKTLRRFLLRWHRSVKMKAPQWQTAAAASAQLYFVSVCVCTVNILLPSRTRDSCVYTLETFMSVYMDVLSVSWQWCCVCAGGCYRTTFCVQYLRLPSGRYALLFTLIGPTVERSSNHAFN